MKRLLSDILLLFACVIVSIIVFFILILEACFYIVGLRAIGKAIDDYILSGFIFFLDYLEISLVGK